MMSLCPKLRAACDRVNARDPKTHAAVQLCALLLPWPTPQVGRSPALDLNLITWVLTVYKPGETDVPESTARGLAGHHGSLTLSLGVPKPSQNVTKVLAVRTLLGKGDFGFRKGR